MVVVAIMVSLLVNTGVNLLWPPACERCAQHEQTVLEWRKKAKEQIDSRQDEFGLAFWSGVEEATFWISQPPK